MTINLDSYKKIALQAAELSGNIIKKYFRNNVSIDIKLDNSPVTIADKQSEEAIRKVIGQAFPNHGIIGEEFEAVNPDAEFQWVIDPIDGTKSFISGFFDFGTIIGLMYQGNPIFGLVHQPILGEIVVGDNQVATCNNQVIRVKPCHELSEAILLTTDFEAIPERDKFNKLTKQVTHYKTWGNCYGHIMVAMGNAHIMIDPIMHLWDIVGLVPIIKGAGGCVSDYYGNNSLHSPSLITCATEHLQKQVIAYLNS